MKEVKIDGGKLEAVPEFCYLGNMISAGGGCELAAVTRCKYAWGKFRQLLPLLTNRNLPLLNRGRIYSTCIRSVMLHAEKTWAVTATTLNLLRRNGRAMIRWICNVPEFCYLGNMISAGGGCELAAVTRCKYAWGKFRQLLPLLTNRNLPLLNRGRIYSTCIRSVMLHAAETWAVTATTLNLLRRNGRAMIRWICNVKAKDEVSSDSLLSKLGIQDLDVVLRTIRMRWFGHVERSTCWIAEVRKLHAVA